MTEKPTSPVYLLELRPPAGDDKPHLALRRLLKYALRVLGWRCLGVVEKQPTAADAILDATEAEVGFAHDPDSG